MRAQVARADEVDAGHVALDVRGHRALGDHHHLLRLAIRHIVDHRRRRSGEVRRRQHLFRAFRVGQDFRARIGDAHLGDVGGGEALMHLAAALPGDDADVGLGRDVARQVFVGDQDDLVDAPFPGRPFHHLNGVGAGAADVGLGLHVGGRVHIGDDGQTGIALLDQAHVRPRDRRGQRAARAQVGDQDGLFRRQDLGRLGHEVHARLDDHLGLGLRGLLGQTQAVADIVADAVENLGRHVVVGQDDGVALLLQRIDLADQLRLFRPLQRRHQTLDLLPHGSGLARQFL
ncbi:hypothetical protein D3C85_1166160 [compost metagenome]